MVEIAKSGLQEILILTGESEKMSDVKYIGEACKIARKYFKVIGLEVYPTNSENYAYWHKCGADYVTVFQETYNSDKYETLHLAGKKRIFPYRCNAQERALKGGMRGVGFAALLGLDDFRKDAFATGIHAYLLQRKYPQAEIAFSCPRLRPIINNDRINPMDVHEAQLLQVVCAYRLLLPFASITVSTRECKRVRDNLIQICATKISAGVDVGIGGRSGEEQGDEQFEIDDTRNVQEVYDLSHEEYEELAGKVLKITNQEGKKCILHTDYRAALSLSHPFVHVPLSVMAQMSQKEREKLRNSVKEMSTSIHSLEQLKEAEAFSMDFVIAGHIFATDCKKDLPPRGLSFLENICDNSEVPVYAIGGMTKEREPEVMRKGASGICIMSGCMRE